MVMWFACLTKQLNHGNACDIILLVTSVLIRQVCSTCIFIWMFQLLKSWRVFCPTKTPVDRIPFCITFSCALVSNICWPYACYGWYMLPYHVFPLHAKGDMYHLAVCYLCVLLATYQFEFRGTTAAKCIEISTIFHDVTSENEALYTIHSQHDGQIFLFKNWPFHGQFG